MGSPGLNGSDSGLSGSDPRPRPLVFEFLTAAARYELAGDLDDGGAARWYHKLRLDETNLMMPRPLTAVVGSAPASSILFSGESRARRR
jgi:hypothetical protein